MFAALCIATATALLLGVRHEPAVRAWALSPRTPRRIAARATFVVRAAGTAVATATALVATGGLLAAALIGAIEQSAAAL
jgi:hypothetical protein